MSRAPGQHDSVPGSRAPSWSGFTEEPQRSQPRQPHRKGDLHGHGPPGRPPRSDPPLPRLQAAGNQPGKPGKLWAGWRGARAVVRGSGSRAGAAGGDTRAAKAQRPQGGSHAGPRLAGRDRGAAGVRESARRTQPAAQLHAHLRQAHGASPGGKPPSGRRSREVTGRRRTGHRPQAPASLARSQARVSEKPSGSLSLEPSSSPRSQRTRGLPGAPRSLAFPPLRALQESRDPRTRGFPRTNAVSPVPPDSALWGVPSPPRNTGLARSPWTSVGKG